VPGPESEAISMLNVLLAENNCLLFIVRIPGESPGAMKPVFVKDPPLVKAIVPTPFTVPELVKSILLMEVVPLLVFVIVPVLSNGPFPLLSW
jgi:hypothetical protein